jgi:hypothetical protein
MVPDGMDLLFLHHFPVPQLRDAGLLSSRPCGTDFLEHPTSDPDPDLLS